MKSSILTLYQGRNEQKEEKTDIANIPHINEVEKAVLEMENYKTPEEHGVVIEAVNIGGITN